MIPPYICLRKEGDVAVIMGCFDRKPKKKIDYGDGNGRSETRPGTHDLCLLIPFLPYVPTTLSTSFSRSSDIRLMNDRFHFRVHIPLLYPLSFYLLHDYFSHGQCNVYQRVNYMKYILYLFLRVGEKPVFFSCSDYLSYLLTSWLVWLVVGNISWQVFYSC
jgi:hypothetical protein